jgi:hypothetical protein
MDDRPTNDLIAQLEGGLSSEGRRALGELIALEEKLANTESVESMMPDTEASLDEALEVLGALPERDRGLVSQILQLRGRAYEGRAVEYLESAKQGRLAVSVIERAKDLERGAGREPDEAMTLGEALEIFQAHGEPVPEHLDPNRLVELSDEEWQTVPAFYPDFGNPENWRRWDGSEQAQAWAKLQGFRDGCIAASVGQLAGLDFSPIDYVGLVALLWGIDEDEAAAIVSRRPGY